MKIGLIPEIGEEMKLKKWYIGVEILRYPPYMFYQGFSIKPYILILCMKIEDYGTEHMEVNGTPRRVKGFWKRVIAPFGIQIAII